jgi:hypothetical protein
VGAFILGIALLLGISSVGVGIFALREVRRTRQLLEETGKRADFDRARLQHLARDLNEAGSTVDKLRKDVAQASAAEAARAAVKARAPAGPLAGESKTDWQRFESTYPEVRQMLADVHKLQIERNMGLFYKVAGLTPEQIAEYENKTIDSFDQNEALAPGPRFNPVAGQLPDDQLQAIFGEQGFQQYQDYTRMMPANYFAVNVQSASGSAGAPLSTDQEQQLAQIVANNDSNYASGKPLQLNAVNWGNVETQAQALLSPAQWAAAQVIFANYQFGLALGQARQNQANEGANK